jgi:hypothetical protein
MKAREQLDRAARLYKRFTGHDAEPLADVRAPRVPRVGLVVGECDGILYTTVRDGEKERYIHRFHAGERPLLVVSPDGKQLMLIGGRFTFTERGIVDRSDVVR